MNISIYKSWWIHWHDKEIVLWWLPTEWDILISKSNKGNCLVGYCDTCWTDIIEHRYVIGLFWAKLFKHILLSGTVTAIIIFVMQNCIATDSNKWYITVEYDVSWNDCYMIIIENEYSVISQIYALIFFGFIMLIWFPPGVIRMHYQTLILWCVAKKTMPLVAGSTTNKGNTRWGWIVFTTVGAERITQGWESLSHMTT